MQPCVTKFAKSGYCVASDELSRIRLYFVAVHFCALPNSVTPANMFSFALWQIIELSGYTTRVSEMFEVFEDVEQGHCQRQVTRELTERRDSIDEAEQPTSEAVGVHGEVVDLSQMSGGKVVDTEGSIALKDIAIITPCGDVVVSSLSFEVSRY